MKRARSLFPCYNPECNEMVLSVASAYCPKCKKEAKRRDRQRSQKKNNITGSKVLGTYKNDDFIYNAF